MFSIFKLTNKINNKTYYGKTRCKFRILVNLMKNYEFNDKLVYYPVLKDQDYSIDILNENIYTLDEIRPYLKSYIENDPNCIQFEKRSEHKPKTEKQYEISDEKKKEYNKIGYDNFKKKGKSKEYYLKNHEKIRTYQKEKYKLIKEKLAKLKEIELKEIENK